MGVVFFRVHVSIREMICIDTKIETLTWITRSRTLHNPSSGTGRLERISCSYSEEKRKKKKKEMNVASVTTTGLGCPCTS